MLEEVPGHVQVVAVGASAAETVCWRMRGELRVTVIVKGCFELVADAPMRVLEPEEMLSAEVHHGRNPSRSVCLTSDLSPYLPKADVVLTGHACAPEGQTIEGIRVRLAVFGERPLLDKSILVYGDTSKTGTRQFDRIPLVYERAYGGIGVADNPFGCGADGGAKMPNLVHPQDAGQVACFGPIGRSWPNRRKLLKNIDRKALEGPILEIPNGFDFAYFQAAPADQQIGHLQGNEWLVLEGMHPRAMQITSCLPAAIARARVYGLGPGPGRSLALAADLLRVDADSLSCQVVWRGSFPLSDASLLDAITIHAGIESAESPIVWPEAPEPRTPSIAAAPAPVAPPARGSSPGSAAAPPAPPSYRGGQPPAAPPGPRDSHPEASGAPSTRRRTPASWDTTMEIPPDLEAQVRSPAVPFRDGPADLAPSPASSRPQKRPPRDFSSTVVLDEGGLDQVAPSTPFSPTGPARARTLGEPSPPREHPPAAPRPAAPPAPPAQVPRSHAVDISSTPAFVRVEPPRAAPARVEPPRAAPARVEPPRVATPPVEPPRVATPPIGPPRIEPPRVATPPVEPSRAEPPRAEPAISPAIGQPVLPGAPSTEELLRAAPAAGPKRERTAEGIELINDTPLALGTVRWDLTPSRDCLTVVAKATCDLVAGGPAKLRAKADPLGGDRLVETGRGSVCVHPSDLVPYKVRADIGLVGHAHAPEGGTTSMQVRFALGQPPLGLDRTLLVFGPRTWEGAGALARPGKPGTFLQLPLRRDSAFGGPGHPENPAGLGFGAGAKGPVRPGKAGKPAPLPHLEDPKSRIRTPKQAPEPACFAPLSRAERELALKADKTPRSLADLFDWSRWQSAPRAMQLPFLAGDEPFEIEGVLPGAKGLSGALPGIAARCVAERASGREEIAMNLDTAIFDLDDRTLTLVWRGVLPVSSEPTPGVRALRLVTVPTEDRHAPLPD